MPIENIPLIGNIANMLGIHSEGWRSNAQLKADTQTRSFLLDNLKEAVMAGQHDDLENMRGAGTAVGIPNAVFDAAIKSAKSRASGNYVRGAESSLLQGFGAPGGSPSQSNVAPAPTPSPLGNTVQSQDITGQPTGEYNGASQHTPTPGQILGSLLAPQTAPAALTPLGQPAPAGSMRPQTAYPEEPVASQPTSAPAVPAPQPSNAQRMEALGLERGTASFHPTQGWSLTVKDISENSKAYSSMMSDISNGMSPMEALTNNMATMHPNAVKNMGASIWNTTFADLYKSVKALPQAQGLTDRDVRANVAQSMADSGYPSSLAPKEIQENIKYKSTDPMAQLMVRNAMLKLHMDRGDVAGATAIQQGVKLRDAGIAPMTQPPAGLSLAENAKRLKEGMPQIVQTPQGPMVFAGHGTQPGTQLTGPNGPIRAPMTDAESKQLSEPRAAFAQLNQLIDLARPMVNERGQYSTRMSDLLLGARNFSTVQTIGEWLSGAKDTAHGGPFTPSEAAFAQKLAAMVSTQNLGRMTENDIKAKIRAWGGGTSGHNIISQLESTRDADVAKHNVMVDTITTQGKETGPKLPLTSELNKAYNAVPQPRYGYGIVFSPVTKKYYYKANESQ